MSDIIEEVEEELEEEVYEEEEVEEEEVEEEEEPKAVAAPVQRRRGRPKGSKNKPKNGTNGATASSNLSVTEEAAPQKKRRGRPPGAKNKSSAATTPSSLPKSAATPTKRGRKKAVLASDAFDWKAQGLPDPATLPVGYMIQVAQQLKTVRDEINKAGL